MNLKLHQVHHLGTFTFSDDLLNSLNTKKVANKIGTSFLFHGTKVRRSVVVLCNLSLKIVQVHGNLFQSQLKLLLQTQIVTAHRSNLNYVTAHIVRILHINYASAQGLEITYVIAHILDLK